MFPRSRQPLFYLRIKHRLCPRNDVLFGDCEHLTSVITECNQFGKRRSGKHLEPHDAQNLNGSGSCFLGRSHKGLIKNDQVRSSRLACSIMAAKRLGKGRPVITTVHAGTPDEAFTAFANNMAISGEENSLSGSELVQNITSQIRCVILLDRRGGMRKVVEIAFPSREESK